jgi:hypothetical protein
MDVITEAEMDQQLKRSTLTYKYNESIDRDSAHEILQRKMEAAIKDLAEEKSEKTPIEKSRRTAEKSTFEQVMRSPVTNTIVRELTRGILGIFNIKTSSRR